ncbi:hypothetical protein Dimus_020992 [Dionaea muscipula]
MPLRMLLQNPLMRTLQSRMLNMISGVEVTNCVLCLKIIKRSISYSILEAIPDSDDDESFMDVIRDRFLESDKAEIGELMGFCCFGVLLSRCAFEFLVVRLSCNYWYYKFFIRVC